MRITQIQSDARKNRITQIQVTIKKAFAAAFVVDKEKLIFEICSQQGVSRRTAREYLEIALLDFNALEEKINGRVFIREQK